MAGVSVALIWIETESNQADHREGFRTLPPPKLGPRWLRRWGVGQRQMRGWEIFAGSARITAAHVESGIEMEEPIDMLWGQDALGAHIDRRLAVGDIVWLWLAPPCSSFSVLRNLDRGGALRPRGLPEGDCRNPEVARGNLLWSRALQLADVIARQGGYFIIEHPRDSKAWLMRQTEVFMSQHVVQRYRVDFCAFHDVENGPLPNQKPTILLSNCPWLENVVKRCPKNHTHGAPLRGQRAKRAGAYPRAFCQQLANACAAWAAGR